jgi:subtilisin family serine protease
LTRTVLATHVGPVRSWRQVGFALLIALAVASGPSACVDSAPLGPGQSTHPSATTSGIVDGARLLVALTTAGPPRSDLLAAIKAAGGRVERVHASIGVLVVSGLPAAAARALARRRDVKTVVADRRIPMVPPHWRHDVGMRQATRTAGPAARGDPHLAQFYVDSTQWNMRITKADQAWSVANQGSGARVCILDTGLDPGQIDLQGKVDATRDTSFVMAGNGTLEPVANDSVGHGTFVAAIVSSNGVGVASVAPQATLCAVKVLGNSGQGSFADILTGIVYAADVGADAINMSFGGYVPSGDPSALVLVSLLQQAVDYAAGRGAVLIAAAGNDAVNTNTGLGPSTNVLDSINLPVALVHVVSAGATGPVDQANFDRIASYSEYGSAGVDVFAPGGDFVDTTRVKDLIISACSRFADTVCADGLHYAVGDGTSFAAPHVSGEAAVAAAQSGFTVRGRVLDECLLNSADELTGVRIDARYGYGRIDVLKAARGCRTPWSFVP